METGRQEIDLPCAASLSKWSPWQRLGQAASSGCPTWLRGTSTSTVCSPRSVDREQLGRWLSVLIHPADLIPACFVGWYLTVWINYTLPIYQWEFRSLSIKLVLVYRFFRGKVLLGMQNNRGRDLEKDVPNLLFPFSHDCSSKVWACWSQQPETPCGCVTGMAWATALGHHFLPFQSIGWQLTGPEAE